MSTSSIARALRRSVGFGGALAASIALVLASSPAASATTTHSAVRGKIDVVKAESGHIRVAGWSLDPFRSSASDSDNVVLDGVMAALPIADRSRPDVAAALHVTGRHGYDVTVRAARGTHRVCVISQPLPNTGGHPVILGCQIVTVTR